MKTLTCFVAVLLAACVARAERPGQMRKEADLVVTGKVTKLVTINVDYGPDGGVTADYIATVKVSKVEKGKAGDTVLVRWSRVVKHPTPPVPGASGQDHKLKVLDTATFWLMKSGKDNWDVIYNSDGVEKVKE